jgi:hypothetical protein
MKRPVTLLIVLIIYCSTGFCIGIPLAIWLAMKDTTGINFISYAVFSAIFGAFCGVVIWIMYRFNLHQRR